MKRRQRKLIRLKDYDYSQPGEYFVTICTHNHECVFGNIVNEEMQLSQTGVITHKCWNEIPKHFPNIELDEYIIMPNHIHGIIVLHEQCRDVQLNVPTRLSPKQGTLSVIIRTFKAAVTSECHRNKFEEFSWQSRFYDHIIRDEKDLQNIREYIANNPFKWLIEKDNPENIPM